MIEIVAVIVGVAVTGLGVLAWNHPKAYAVLSPWLTAFSAIVGTLFYGASAATEGAVEKLMPFLNTDGVVRANALLDKAGDQWTWFYLIAYFAAVAFIMLGGLQFLPRGRD